MVRNSNRDSEFSSKKFTDSLQTESSCAIYRHMMILPLPKHHRVCHQPSPPDPQQNSPEFQYRVNTASATDSDPGRVAGVTIRIPIQLCTSTPVNAQKTLLAPSPPPTRHATALITDQHCRTPGNTVSTQQGTQASTPVSIVHNTRVL